MSGKFLKDPKEGSPRMGRIQRLPRLPWIFGPQDGPRCLQDAHKSLQDTQKRPQVAHKTSEDGSRRHQDHPKTAQDTSKTAQDVPKTALNVILEVFWSKNVIKLITKSQPEAMLSLRSLKAKSTIF